MILTPLSYAKEAGGVAMTNDALVICPKGEGALFAPSSSTRAASPKKGLVLHHGR